MKTNTDPQKIEELLTRGVENIYPKREFLEAQLKSGKQLTLYTGYDPTAPTLHIGHGITMLKLRQFQELGHKVIMLIGDFTGMIGDPTDKTSARQKLTRKQVLENCKNYKKQAANILDFDGENPVEVRFNSEWLGKLTFAEVVELSSYFTVQQMLERDMFEKRLRGEIQCAFCDTRFTQPYYTLADLSTTSQGTDFSNITKCPKCEKTVREMIDKGERTKLPQLFIPKQPIYLHEFLYPLMQGYDSVAMDVDGEVGGNDQTFNMLTGRDLMKIGIKIGDKKYEAKEKFVLTLKLLVDSSGKKMGKTEGNMVAFSDSPEDMFGKVMSWTDGMIKNGFELCTTLLVAEIEKYLKEIQNPRDQKLLLGYEIVKTFLGEPEALKAQQNFIRKFSEKEAPDEIPELKPSALDIITVLVEAKICKSKSEARQVISQGGVKINDKKVEGFEIQVKAGDVVQKGSRFFVKIK
jgi:tyrosyl-tRNA synthetase